MIKKYINTITLTSVILITTQSQAAYVSPNEYKNHSCDELKEDYLGYSKASFENLTKSVNAHGTRRSDGLAEKGEEIQAQINAIKKASERKGCPVVKPKDKPSPEK